ncbi:MAG: CCA tRNA nucleotidyltransferase [Dehalococcoidia bacterium]
MNAERTLFVAAITAAGYQLWTVGGALRDELLRLGGHDEDFATDALPDVVEELARSLGRHVVTVGKRFGTIGVRLDGLWSEVTTFRGDSYEAGTRWPDVRFGQTIEEDLARRDFTINALARNAATGEVLDLFGSAADLAAGLIRAVGEPAARFREDPLRILRGLRFASQLDFAIEDATLAGMKATAPLLATLSQERVTAELDKLLQGPAPARGLDVLEATGALAVVLPELAGMPGCAQNRFHQFDVWGHTLATVAAIGPGGPQGRVRRWAALLHDLGKPYVRHTKNNGEWGFYRHDTVGADLAEGLLARLKVAKQDARTITLLVRRHMDRPNLDDRRSLRRFIAKSEGHWADLIALKRADNASHTYDDTEYHDRLERLCLEVTEAEAAALRAESPLSGDDLVALFDKEPGPWIRPIKERLSALVLDGDLRPGDREAAERIARRMLR